MSFFFFFYFSFFFFFFLMIRRPPRSTLFPTRRSSDLDEVQLVLGPRLRELTVPPPRRRYGAVLITTAEAARGLGFDVVFVPGLAEKLFPRKIVEDPILLDAEREALGVPALTTRRTRGAAERLALRVAIGAARARVFLSYPRIDVEQA